MQVNLGIKPDQQAEKLNQELLKFCLTFVLYRNYLFF